MSHTYNTTTQDHTTLPPLLFDHLSHLLTTIIIIAYYFVISNENKR